MIRMLNYYLGSSTFAAGVTTYLKEFAYGNAQTADLWRHLSAASGKDVAALMSNWTGKTGYPVVVVDKEEFKQGTLTLHLSQSRFLSDGSSSSDGTVWWIPLGITTHITAEPIDTMLSTVHGTVSIPYGGSSNQFYKINGQCRGFYRVNADPTALGQLVASNSVTLSLADRVGLCSDAFAMAVAGYGSTRTLLALLQAFSAQQDYMFAHLTQSVVSHDRSAQPCH